MNSVSKENVERILKEEADKKSELDLLIGTSLQQMWLNDLEELEHEYNKYKSVRIMNQQEGGVSGENIVLKKRQNKMTK
jgi:hypothetical protein